MKVIIIPFHNYNTVGNDPLGRMLLSFVQRNLGRYNADVIYLVGNRKMFQILDNKVEYYGKTKVEYVVTPNGNFNENFWVGVNKLNDGDQFILIDSDLMIYDFTLIDDLFRDLEIYDLINCVDNGTRVKPTYETLQEIPTADVNDERNLPYKLQIMRPTEYRYGRTRFTHWLFACNYDFFKRHSANFNDGNYEAFEPFTRNIAQNEPYARIKELPEIRNNILIHEGSDLVTVHLNSDDIRNTDELVKSSKYYHVRNFGSMAQAVSQLQLETIKFSHSPFAEKNYWEMMRIIAWNFVVMEKIWSVDVCNNYRNLINRILAELNISDNLDSEKFNNYYKKFKEYHRTWLL